jgi:hypothetical protein
MVDMGMMKGIDEFIWVLAIALVLVVIFMGAAALTPYIPGGGGGNQSNGTSGGGGTIAAYSQIGFVGYSSSYAGQGINYGSFVVGQPQAENLKRATQLDICAGLWCDRKQEFSVSVPSYYMDTLRGVKISFAIYDTNQYGDLVVKWNGREFHRARSASQDYVISIDKDYVRDSNTLQIYAEGPGLMFWASTIYTLRDFKADVEYGPAVIRTFTLSQGELSAWNSGELNLYASGDKGQLRVRMNGNVVYQGMPYGQQAIALNYTNAGPKVGENLLVFDALGGGVFSLSNVQLKLYLLTNQIVKSKTFALSQADYSKLGSGRITFYVNSAQRSGDMTMKLNGKYLSVPKISAGTNVVYFTRNEAAQGGNTLEMTGSGYWDIGDMTVAI